MNAWPENFFENKTWVAVYSVAQFLAAHAAQEFTKSQSNLCS